jgi:hypothetical protein
MRAWWRNKSKLDKLPLDKSGLDKFDGFVKNPISALRFIPLSLRRTTSTPHSTGFARLELGLFTKPSVVMTFYDFITVDSGELTVDRQRSLVYL